MKKNLSRLIIISLLLANIFTLANAQGITQTCPSFTRILMKGVNDGSYGDVSALQFFLKTKVSGYFDARTELALKKWQKKYKVVSSGSPKKTGYGALDAKTMGKIMSVCQNREIKDPVISRDNNTVIVKPQILPVQVPQIPQPILEKTQVSQPAQKNIIAEPIVATVKMDNQLPAAPKPIISADARIIGYKITSMMYDSVQQKAIPTPQPIIDKIHKAFELWESDENVKIGFRYDGLGADHYDSRNEIPSDGRIYVVLNAVNQSSDPGAAGIGGYEGTIPGDYKKGYAFLEMRKRLAAATLKDIVHEIGHALGLDHVPSNSSIMSCGTATWGDREVLAISELDRTYLTKLWAPDAASRLYSISGKVLTTPNEFPFVHAVNTVNGHTYSTLANSSGNYNIPLLVPGQYRVFAKGYESGAFDKTVSKSPSWYISDGQSTNDPYKGTVITVNPSNRNTANINIKMIEEPVPFNFFWTSDQNGPTGPYTFNHAFLKKGGSGDVELAFTNEATISSVEAYGSSPDYSVSNLHTRTWQNGGTTNYYPVFKISANANAEAGDRLVIARGPSGNIQAGLIGVHIIGTKDPSFISNNMTNSNQNFELGESGWIKEQIEKNFNFNWLDATYWKQ